MANDALARAYAQAIFEQAVGRWKKQLGAVRDAIDKHPDMVPGLDNAAEPFDRKRDELNRLLPPNSDAEARNFLYLLASRGDLHLLGEILGEFDRFSAHGPAAELARVTSAIELTAAERSQLESKLRTQFGKNLDVEYKVDPSILGGVIVRVGDRVIDGSVASKLAAMRQKLETTR